MTHEVINVDSLPKEIVESLISLVDKEGGLGGMLVILTPDGDHKVLLLKAKIGDSVGNLLNAFEDIREIVASYHQSDANTTLPN